MWLEIGFMIGVVYLWDSYVLKKIGMGLIVYWMWLEIGYVVGDWEVVVCGNVRTGLDFTTGKLERLF